MFFKEKRSKYKPAYAINTQHVLNCSCLYRDFTPGPHSWPLALTPGPHLWPSLLALTPGPHLWPLALTRGPHSWPSLVVLTPGPHSWPSWPLAFTPGPHSGAYAVVLHFPCCTYIITTSAFSDLSTLESVLWQDKHFSPNKGLNLREKDTFTK